MEKPWKKVEMSPTWNDKNEEGEFMLKDGDSIEGVLVEIQENVGPNKSMLYTLKTDKGSVSVWGSTVLNIRLKHVAVGDEVKIVYLGLEASEKVKGRHYHNYDVYHREADKVVEEGIDLGMDNDDDPREEEIMNM